MVGQTRDFFFFLTSKHLFLLAVLRCFSCCWVLFLISYSSHFIPFIFLSFLLACCFESIEEHIWFGQTGIRGHYS